MSSNLKVAKHCYERYCNAAQASEEKSKYRNVNMMVQLYKSLV